MGLQSKPNTQELLPLNNSHAYGADNSFSTDLKKIITSSQKISSTTKYILYFYITQII